MLHKICITKKEVAIPRRDSDDAGKLKITAAWPESGFLTYEAWFWDKDATVIQSATEQIEKILLRAMDEIASVEVDSPDMKGDSEKC